MSGVDWNTRCNRIINLYTSYCDKWLHFGGDGLSCPDYTSSLYHIAQFAGTAAHEMGHGMGLDDLYPSASVNHGYTIKANSEIVYSSSYFALPAAGVIMKYNGRATENDVEMLQFVNIGVAMGNSSDKVKACADYVTGTVDEDGVAKAIEHFADLFV